MASYKPVNAILGERWKKLPPKWPMYEVSNFARVRRVSIVNPTLANTGYHRVYLRTRNGQRMAVLVHRLVARAFLGRHAKGKVVHHKDHDRLNNLPENLQYVTPYENFRFAVAAGRMPTRMSGEEHGLAKLTWAKVEQIRRLNSRGASERRLATQFGVTKHAIHLVLKRRTWTRKPRTPHHTTANGE